MPARKTPQNDPVQLVAGTTRRRMTGRRATRKPVPQRRGTFLVFVVGALSLLTVAVVAYVAVGTSDRRASIATATSAERGDVSKQAADYFRSVIADDLFDTVPDAATGRERREVTDYPFTSPQFRAKDDTMAGPDTSFAASGRNGTDSWLASTEPTWLNPNFDPPSNAALPFMDRQDWAHISNFAPTGRFINLANLRDSFDAEPGAGGSGGPNDPWLMSDRLSLIDRNLAFDADLTIQDYAANQTTAYGEIFNLSNPNNYRPAYFTRWQQSAFRPMVDPELDPTGAQMTFASPESIFNQWADADGDGFADSRWFELTDFDPLAGANGEYQPLVPRLGGLRWVFAARAIDLSGLVNVNTASDFRGLQEDAAAARAFPAGATPADIDLHRLLTLQDTHWDPAAAGTLYHYDAFEQPRDGAGNADDAQPGYYGAALGADVRVLASQAGDLGMLQAQPTSDPSAVMAGITGGLRGRVPLLTPRVGSAYAGYPSAFPDWGVGPAFNAAHRGLTYTQLTGPGTSSSTAGLLTDGRGVSGDALLELLTYRGVNDPNATSTLESAIGGRYTAAYSGASATNLWSPLRDNRPLQLERGLRDGDGEDRDFSELDTFDYLQGRPSARALAHAVADIRQRLTTISGARPITDDVNLDLGAAMVSSELTARDLRIDAAEYLEELADFTGSTSPGTRADAWEATQQIFRGYADALLPHSSTTNAWDFFTTRNTRTRTLAYGYRGPETALSIAAHLTANMIDLYDDDRDGTTTEPQQEITALTVLVYARERNVLEALPGTVDDWTAQAESPEEELLDLDNIPVDPNDTSTAPGDRLADGDNTFSRAFNVYGFEAHPVISEVAMITMLTDAPESLGGDEDWDNSYDPMTEQPLGNATIDGSISTGNDDFIARILAVQVTNPYDDTIQMWDPADGGAPRYYIEYGGKFYALTNIPYDASTNTWPLWADSAYVGDEPNTEDLEPGKSRVYIAIGEDPGQPQTRLAALTNAYQGAGLNTGMLAAAIASMWNDWLDRYLTVRDPGGFWTEAPAIMPQIQPYGAVWAAGTGNTRIVPTDPQLVGGITEEFQQVLLWRRVINDDRDTGAGNERLATNHPYNDILIDRIRQESDSTIVDLDRSLPPSDTDVSNGNTGPDPLDGNYDAGGPNGNLGYTAVLYSGIRRADGNAADIGAGGIPGWVLESKTRLTSKNALFEDALNEGSPVGEFENPTTRRFAYPDFTEFLDHQFGAFDQFDGGNGLVDDNLADLLTIGEPPVRKTPSNPIGLNLSSTAFGQLVAEHHLLNNRFESEINGIDINAMRIGDMLLPKAIGARFDPYALTPGTTFTASTLRGLIDPANPAQRIGNLDRMWTTFGEALAVALDYERDYDGDGVTDPFAATGHPLDALGEPISTDIQVAGGNSRDIAVLDRGQLVLDAFVPFLDDTPNGQIDLNEPLAGDGLPLALGVFDRFTVFDERFGDLARATPGLININTASAEVLRTIPMLAPLFDFDPSGTLENQWWWNTPQHEYTSDLAASVQAYRDKVSTVTRRVLNQSGAVEVTPEAVDFVDAANPRPDNIDNEGRRAATSVPALRETPGFASIGELMAVRTWTNPATTPRTAGLHDIDRLGFDALDINNGDGLVSIRYTDYGDQNNNGNSSEDRFESLPDDYDERLIIANALMNTVTVRSDYFAVWFIAHGYGPGDVEGLRDDQPMTPTVRRRYLLVVDRSNVTSPGERPRVVLFQELPL